MADDVLKITLDDIVGEITRLENAQMNDGFTITELMAKTGRGRRSCTDRLRLLVANGKAECAGRKKVARIDGQINWVPVYRLIVR